MNDSYEPVLLINSSKAGVTIYRSVFHWTKVIRTVTESTNWTVSYNCFQWYLYQSIINERQGLVKDTHLLLIAFIINQWILTYIVKKGRVSNSDWGVRLFKALNQLNQLLYKMIHSFEAPYAKDICWSWDDRKKCHVP